MASNYVESNGEAGRFHGHNSTTPTGAAASSPRQMRRSFSSASSGHGSHGAAPKCVCAPPTHAGSFKCRLHRTNSHGHGHPHASPPTSPAGASATPAPAPAPAASPPPAVSSASSRTVEAQ